MVPGGAFYPPGCRDGSKLGVNMMCLGQNWSPETKYDVPYRRDGSEPPPIPDKLISMVDTSIQAANSHLNPEDEFLSMYPDTCLANFYEFEGGLDLHQVTCLHNI